MARQSGSDRSWSRCCSWRAPRPRPNGPTCNPSSSSPGSTSICASGPTTSEPPIFMKICKRTPRRGSGFTPTCSASCSTTCSTTPASTARREHPSTSASGVKTNVVALAVQDRGWGLAAEDRLHVFEPFFRSAEARRRGLSGVGLGLAVVQRIAAVFGGTISVDSEPGRGSRFVLRLPDAKASMAMLDQAQPPRR